ncbi:MAG: 30S ribosome-binding factor RbfA [Deltaproteobacteria bacterium]|nr:30S ribosome-binding factor RbfA [Deltaproteobacteria bacterium]
MQPHRPFDRASRVAEQIRQIVAQLCHERFSDPRLVGLQITRVKVARDLRLARIHYFLRGPEAAIHECQRALEHAAGLMKHAINEQIALKFTPELKFHFDDAIEHGERINDLLRELQIDSPAEQDES